MSAAAALELGPKLLAIVGVVACCVTALSCCILLAVMRNDKRRPLPRRAKEQEQEGLTRPSGGIGLSGNDEAPALGCCGSFLAALKTPPAYSWRQQADESAETVKYFLGCQTVLWIISSMYSPLLIMPVLFLRPKITALLVAFGSIGGKGGCWNRCWRRCCPSEGYRRGGLLYNLPVARRAARWELCLFGYHVFCTTVFCGAAIYAYSLAKLYHDDLDDEEGDNAAAGAAAGTDGGEGTMENLSKAGVIFSVVQPPSPPPHTHIHTHIHTHQTTTQPPPNHPSPPTRSAATALRASSWPLRPSPPA